MEQGHPVSHHLSPTQQVQNKVIKKPEPYYNLINDQNHFRVLCSTQDDQNMPMRDDILVIEKKGCIIYNRRK